MAAQSIYKIQHRRGTLQDWMAVDPILADGEIGVVSGLGTAKMGDGVRPWSQLPYFVSQTDIDANLEDYAPLNSPVFTGNPTAPTPPVDDDDTSIATTEFVRLQSSTSDPLPNGSVTPGISRRFARADHIHPYVADPAFKKFTVGGGWGTYNGNPANATHTKIPLTTAWAPTAGDDVFTIVNGDLKVPRSCIARITYRIEWVISGDSLGYTHTLQTFQLNANDLLTITCWHYTSGTNFRLVHGLKRNNSFVDDQAALSSQLITALSINGYLQVQVLS